MPREPDRDSDERLLRVLAARRLGETLDAIAQREGVTASYLSREIAKVRDSDIACARREPRDEIRAAYAKGSSRCPGA